MRYLKQHVHKRLQNSLQARSFKFKERTIWLLRGDDERLSPCKNFIFAQVNKLEIFFRKSAAQDIFSNIGIILFDRSLSRFFLSYAFLHMTVPQKSNGPSQAPSLVILPYYANFSAWKQDI